MTDTCKTTGVPTKFCMCVNCNVCPFGMAYVCGAPALAPSTPVPAAIGADGLIVTVVSSSAATMETLGCSPC